MIARLRHPLSAIVASAVLLTGVLGWMVLDRVWLLRKGREIVLPIRPVDPRDLFKGDYARLGYDISRLDRALFAPGDWQDGIRQDPLANVTVYVTLEQQGDQTWKPVAVTRRRPAPQPPGRVVLRGRTQSWDQSVVAYGLERYFVPEGTGGRIEDMARKSQLSAIVAVDASGRAAIKGLVHEGRRIYEEPLF